MAPPVKPGARPAQSAAGENQNPPSNNLWIGNLAPEVGESDLKALFETHGKIDSVSSYPSRNYAFVYFKEIESAKSAKQALQGHVLRGNPLKIEFAKPAKPCKSLWVAGIGQSVSKEDLEKEFLKFGKIQEFRFLKDRSTVYVAYVRLDDAIQALKSMNGKRIGGDHIRVDFLRSQPSRREPSLDARESHFAAKSMGPSDLRWMAPGPLKNYPEPGLAGSKRHHHLLSMGSHQGGPQPSNVLWISYPPSVVIEEDMLHNAMILFGEIERIKTFPDRNYAFVEFRSIEEARRAKEGLQGKLFNDPRISIEYSSDEFPGAKGLGGEFPFRPLQVDVLGLHRPGLPSNIPGRSPALGIAPDAYVKPPFVSHGTFEPPAPVPEFSDFGADHKLPHSSPQGMVGGPNWRRTSPTPGVISSPSGGLNLPNRSVSGAWDVFDASQLQREFKRARFDSAMPLERTGPVGGLDEHYSLNSPSGGRASGSLARITTGGLGRRHAESDYTWRGIIAKGGNPVCRARCVPLGEGIGFDIPDVVNCCARTGLDLLCKHYEDAIGFDIVFFLPDSEEDFASYTEFLRFLGSKNRAGVAKFDDGTTLFLVPPSDFLATVLKVSGPERLYGVVLKFPEVVPSSTSSNPVPVHPRYAESHKVTPLPRVPGGMSQEERILPIENSSVRTIESKLPPKTSAPLTSPFLANSVPPTVSTSQAGVALTPELIATLTSLLPVNNLSGLQAASLPQAASILAPSTNAAPVSDSNMMHWRHDPQVLDHNPQTMQRLGSQINPQMQHVDHALAPAFNPIGHFPQMSNPYSQLPENMANLPLQGAVSTKPMASAVPLQSGPGTVMPHFNQQYQQSNPQDMSMGAGIDHGTDAFRLYNSTMVQQPAYAVGLSNQSHGNSAPQPHSYMPLPPEGEHTYQSQTLQNSLYGATQESSEAESDKNERYKTTLLFAANLLSRIHQQPGNQPGQGAGSQ